MKRHLNLLAKTFFIGGFLIILGSAFSGSLIVGQIGTIVLAIGAAGVVISLLIGD